MRNITAWVFILGIILAVASLSRTQLRENKNVLGLKRNSRSVDPDFLRRYNHLRRVYRHNPLAFDFFKYFLRNRGQRREKRQVNNLFPNNNFGLNSTNSGSTNSPQNNKTTRTKPFRPPMLFF